MGTMTKVRAYRGPVLLSYGFRPFFLFGAIYAGVMIPLWLAVFAGDISLPTAFAPLAVDLSDTANDVKFVRLMDGASNLVGKINNWTLELANNITPLEVQGTPGAVDLIYGMFSPSVKVEAYFDNSAQIDAATDNDDLEFDVCIDNGDFMFSFWLPRVAMRNDQLQIQANTQVRLNFPTLEAAQVYCEREGFAYAVTPAPQRKLKLQAYADNFR